jgi:futalosine hydrolase
LKQKQNRSETINHPGKRCIGLISAITFEGSLFVAESEKVEREKTANLVFYMSEKGKHPFVYAASGIGKANAAHAAAVMIRDYFPSIIVSFGIGGAYPSSGLKVGDLAVARSEIHADEGILLKDGFHALKAIGIPTLRASRRWYFNDFPADKTLTRKALRAAGHVSHASAGRFATVACCTGTRKRALEIEKRFDVICENMEGAAVAQMSRLYGVPFVEIRGISNIVEDRDTRKWRKKLAAENCQRAVKYFLETAGILCR